MGNIKICYNIFKHTLEKVEGGSHYIEIRSAVRDNQERNSKHKNHLLQNIEHHFGTDWNHIALTAIGSDRR